MNETKIERYGGVPRGELEDSDFVDRDARAFPVMTAQDVRDAVSSWGRYKGELTFEEFKHRLTALAKRKGLEDALPAAWSASETATKAGRRHNAGDLAVLKAMCDDYKAYAEKMSDYFKALGFADADDDGLVTPDEVAVKTLDVRTLATMVEDAVLSALEDLDLVEDTDEPEMVDLRDAAEPMLASYRKAHDGYPVVKVYIDYAVACLEPGVEWQIPYAMDGGEIALATPDQWIRVGPEWAAIPDAAPIVGGEIKMLPDGRIEGYAVRFGSADEPDLSEHRDYFTSDTDFWLDRWQQRPMLYHHAMDPATKALPVIGAWTEAGTDEVGVWLRGQLDKAHRYHAAIKELARRGLLRISSDSAPHLVVREPQAGGVNYVKRWPLAAASLTPTPAEPRLLPVEYKAVLAELGLPIDASSEADDPALRERPTLAEADAVEAMRLLALELDILAMETDQ